MKRSGYMSARLCVALMSAGLYSGCSAFLDKSGPLPIVFSEEVLALAWEADDTGIDGSGDTVARFNVYYRELGTLPWVFLSATPDGSPATTINRGVLIGGGSFEFAVQSVYADGTTSELHKSSDFSASPPGGWYLKWN
mgnify:CR=1 FL=1